MAMAKPQASSAGKGMAGMADHDATAGKSSGMNKPLESAEHLHGLVAHSSYEVIVGAPHNVYYEAATEYNRRLDAFLARVPVD